MGRERKYYHYHDVANIFECSERTITRMITNGEIIKPENFGKRGKPVRWYKPDFDSWYHSKRAA
jgi:predicted DNA-binding transcriptional regulator AlpA